ncbi:hypothetical protein HNP86_001346 [Methanococcus maripaludis]|uniref:Uncharacterized protein n=1 Tax=Methanococcus maripaludis TaxID=39152 RepID=A0A7J9NV64_METMI|nr:hypothetical protein [Methanococcus maripaludis]MBA2851215.1 hypothetical protein [Methanococcus maripaludis]
MDLVSELIVLITIVILFNTILAVSKNLIKYTGKFGVRILILVIVSLIMSVTFMISIFLVDYLKLIVSSVPIEYMLVSALIVRFVTIASQNAMIKYGLKKGIITKKEI